MEAQLTRTKVWLLARAQIVNCPRQQFLSRTSLPQNQDRGVSGGHGFDLFQNSPDGFAMADDLLKIELGFQLIFQILLLLASWSLSSEICWNAMALPIAMATCPAIWVSMAHIVFGKVSRTPAEYIQRSQHAFPSNQRNPAARLQRLMSKLGRRFERPFFVRLPLEQQWLPGRDTPNPMVICPARPEALLRILELTSAPGWTAQAHACAASWLAHRKAPA